MALETILLIAFCISILSATICRAGEIFSFQSISFCTIRSSNKAYSRFRRAEKSIFSFRRPTLDDFMRETVSISCTMLSIVLMISRERDITTRIFLDEFHLLLKEPQTAAYTAEIYKRFRKWNGIPTSLTQNVKDLLDSSEIENILENSDFVLMLNQGASDRNILAQRLGISPQELSHVTNSSEGEGLLFFGDKIIPFEDKFPRDTQLYRVMTTKPSDLAA